MDNPHTAYQLRSQISNALNQQYLTKQFNNLHSFPSFLIICQSALRKNIYPLLYQITSPQIQKYGMNINYCEQNPFEEDERNFIQKLASVCEAIIQDPGYKYIEIVNKFVKQGKLLQLKLKGVYRRFQLNFRYVNIKQAMVYTALSQCNVWYTIVKNRKKSKKQFDLDALIQYFQNFILRLKLQNPFHLNILPKKAVKSIQRKVNQQKTTNSLFDAVTKGDHDLVKQMLQKGAKIQLPAFLNNRQKTQVKCAHRACLNGDLKICKILDSFGVNWQSEDSQKMTPIFYAIQAGNFPVIKYLVQELKVNIQKLQIQSRTPFYWACTQGDINIIDYFYKAGCNINHKSELGRTALSKSCYLGRIDIVQYLLKCKQIDMYSQCKKGRTALHNAVFGPKGGRQGHKFGTNDKDSPECAQILLQHGMNVDILDFQDCTSLHIAMSSDAIDSIRLLVAYGTSLTAKNNYGQTPFMTGAKFGHVNACKFLYEQCGADILAIDIFNKNVLLLTAKFQQNAQQQGGINPVYLQFMDPFIKQCQKLDKIQQLYRTFSELVSNQFSQKLILQIVQLWKAFKKFGIPKPKLQIIQIQKILQVSMKCATVLAAGHQQGQQKRQQNQAYLKFTSDVLSQINLSPQKIKQIHVWLLKRNQPKILQFVHDNDILSLNKIQLTSQQFMNLIESDEYALKQKVVTFCIICLNFDWINYRTAQNSNILHILVRKQRSGCILQLFKALSGKIPQKMLTNTYLQKLTKQQCHKVIQQLLWQKDESGFDAHQLSLVLKNKSVAKLIQQKLKQQNLQFSSVLDVKQYAPILQTDPIQLELFTNYQHEQQQILIKFQQKINKMGKQQIMQWYSWGKNIHGSLQLLKTQISTYQSHQNFTKQIQSRPLYFIKTQQQLHKLQTLQNQPVVGIDLQYFNYQGITMISLFQISSLKEDFIIDCLHIQFKKIKKYIQPILYNQKIVKIMHGADNDLILIKSLFNLSVINFIDTSRLDIQLRENKFDLRGLATLAKDYLGFIMSKQYQVSQWRIRPIPKAMLQYAKKDSLILPYLLLEMLHKINHDQQKIKQFILGGCKQVRRNKKTNQPLIKGIRQL